MIWGVTLKPGEDYTEIMGSEVHLSMAALECRPRLAAGKDLTAHVIMKTADGEYLLCTLGSYGPTPQQALDLILQPSERITFSVEGSGIVYLTGYTPGYALSEYCDNQERGYEEENDFQQVQEEDLYPPEEGEDEYIQEHQKNDIMSDNADIVVKGETLPGRDGEDGKSPSIEEMVDAVQQNEFVDETNLMPAQKEQRLPPEAEFSASSDLNVRVSHVNQDETAMNSPEYWDINTATFHTEITINQNVQNCCFCSKPTTTVKNFYEGPNIHTVFVRPCCTNCPTAVVTLPRVADPEQTSSPQRTHIQDNSVSYVAERSEISGHSKDPLIPTSSSPHQSVQYRVNRKPQRRGISQTSSTRTFDKTILDLQPHQSSSRDLHQQTRQGISRAYINKCSYCPKWFTSVSGRKIHERMHTGEKPYKCGYCPRAFTQSTNLKSHERTHTGEKPHQCSYCKKSFIRTDALKSHERTHTGEKPFKCMHCPRAFAQRGMWKKHEQAHQLT